MAGSLVAEAVAVFAVIFAFEIVDRTNFAVISLAGKHPHVDVWIGAALAFFVSSAISVGIGVAVVTLLPKYLFWVKVAGGLVLIAFGLREMLDKTEEEAEKAEGAIERKLPRSRVWTLAFSIVLFLEMGDNTQFLTFQFVWAAGTSPPLEVLLVIFLAATAALWCVAAIGARSGEYLKRRVPAEKLEKILGGILVVIGLLTIVLAYLAQYQPGALPAF